MQFEKLFRILSYAAVFCGFFALWVSGTFGVLGVAVFVAIMAIAWVLESTRFQITERIGTALIVASIPLYYLLWRWRFFEFATVESMLPGILARLILTLSAIKLLQRKSDRDWIFLYIMAFFQVLLAAGLSISAMYLFAFVMYIFVMACTIILFEMKRTDRLVEGKASVRPKPDEDSKFVSLPVRRIPAVAVGLIVLIVAFATPMFFLLPRVGGAGIGGSAGTVSTSSGFSDTVRLGGIGRIQQNDEVVMRVRVEGRLPQAGRLKWRGVALDTFDNQAWSKSRATVREPRTRGERDLIQIDYANTREGLTLQTFYLEPLDSPVLFALPRAVGVQSNFQVLFKDAQDALYFQRVGERVSYKVLSDIDLPPAEELRADNTPYGPESRNYLQLPFRLDSRITELADFIVGPNINRYDSAAAIESYLQNSFGYTLEQKASGPEPLSDFLFNVREGHCEYFATAMAVMLRTQGIATRVVNGFQQGDYNDAADIYVVRQKNAHSWVEVYFPEKDVWVPFDPTPFAGQETGSSLFGITGRVGKYLEALEMFWIQYFVAFDNQEQRSLFTSVRRGIADYNEKASSWTNDLMQELQSWWQDVRGDQGFGASVTAVGWGVGVLALAIAGLGLFVWMYRWAVRLKVWSLLWNRLFARRNISVVEFYDRMQRVLATKGIVRELHQTPLEFANAVRMPEAVRITETYNRVRFGEKNLSRTESDEIESWLKGLSAANFTKDTKDTWISTN
jgi:transglutaminase-like putative cysteine protease